jgi:hypothetical protein
MWAARSAAIRLRASSDVERCAATVRSGEGDPVVGREPLSGTVAGGIAFTP